MMRRDGTGAGDPLYTEFRTERLRIVPQTREEMKAAKKDGPFSEAVEELLLRARKDFRRRFGWYANRLIYRLEDGCLIGSLAFMNSPGKDPDRQGLVELGYETLEPFRGKGYMTEAVAAARDWAVSQPRVSGIICGVKRDNPASVRVLQKCGFRKTDESELLNLEVWCYFPENGETSSGGTGGR